MAKRNIEIEYTKIRWD